MDISVARGDITTLGVDAIVNAANEQLAPGGGVCGAIFAAAGREELQAACQAVGGCATGQAVATPGFGLAARWVIHAVGPRWQGGRKGEGALLASCYRAILEVADGLGARTVAIPAIATGTYGYPADEAAEVAVGTLTAACAAVHEVVLVAFDEASAQRYEALLAGR